MRFDQAAITVFAWAIPAMTFAGDAKITFHRDVEPVLQARCQGCHRPGEAAPMPLLTYSDARPWAKAIKQAAVTRKMPPWSADESVGHFRNDRRLSESEISTLAKWADAGAPEGNPKDAPAPLEFTEGWAIGKPDAILNMPIPYDVPAEGTIDYQWILIPGFKEDKWVQAFGSAPGESRHRTPRSRVLAARRIEMDGGCAAGRASSEAFHGSRNWRRGWNHRRICAWHSSVGAAEGLRHAASGRRRYYAAGSLHAQWEGH
jgi:hypothetical protein